MKRSRRKTICISARNLQIKYALLFGGSFIILLIVTNIYVTRMPKETFKKPEFEQNVEEADAKIEDISYHMLDVAPGYQVGLCGMPKEKDRQLTVYFTNEKGNQVWMQLLVLDQKQKVLGETGILKPGERVSKITLSRTLKKEETLKLKVNAYEPDTYYSAGEVTLETKTKAG